MSTRTTKYKFREPIQNYTQTYTFYYMYNEETNAHLSSPFIHPTDAQLDCSKRMSKFTLKYSYMFRFNNHHQGATIRALLKL